MDIAKIKELTARMEFHRGYASKALTAFNVAKEQDFIIYYGVSEEWLKEETEMIRVAYLQYQQLMCELHQKRAFELLNEIVALMPESLRE